MKFVLFFALIATLSVVVLCRDGYWGQRQPGDFQVVSKNITKFPKSGKAHTEKFSYDVST